MQAKEFPSQKIFVSPQRYVQSPNALMLLDTHLKALDFRRPFLVATQREQDRFTTPLNLVFSSREFDGVSAVFGGECSKKEISRLLTIAIEKKCDVVVGVGGGKALDCAKTVAFHAKIPVIVAPTIASTDAPCSAVSVIYRENGEFEEYIHFNRNPDLVLVDTALIVQAPVRYLVAGMGDALATFFEARACQRSYAKNNVGGKQTLAGFAIAKLCYETLLNDAEKALAACEAKMTTEAFENIVEANILLSGLGFESGGLAAAHALHNGLTVLTECHDFFHGEKVAWGTLVQLALENAPLEEFKEVYYFCKKVGLPTELAHLGIKSISNDQLRQVAKRACAPKESIHNMPFRVTEESVMAAIATAERLCRRLR